MKKFKFKFQALLNIELHREDAVKQELKTALHYLHKEEEIMSNLKRMYLMQQEELARKQPGLLSPEEFKLYETYIFALCSQMAAQQAKIKEREEEVDEIRQRLVEISRRRKVLEKLREKKKNEYDYHFQQYQNKLLDELAVTRFNHDNQL